MNQKLLVPDANPHLPEIPKDFADLVFENLDPVEELRKALYSNMDYAIKLSVNKAGSKVAMNLLSGQLLGDNSREGRGPQRADVMLIGKMCSLEEQNKKQIFCRGSDYGDIIVSAFKRAGVSRDEMRKFYATNLLKTTSLEPSTKKFPKLWVDNQVYLLWQEILLVRPKFCLLLGNDVIKAVLGTKFNLKKTEGKVIEKTFDVSTESREEFFTTNFMVATSPGAVLVERANPAQRSDGKFLPHAEKRFNEQIKEFADQFRGKDKPKEEPFEWELVDNEVALIKALKKMRKECADRLVAWDAEWQGEHPANDGSYLRCLQFAYKKNHAVVVALTYPGGEPRFRRIVKEDGSLTTDGGLDVALQLCKKAMKGLRVAGHFFMADLEWMRHFGLDLLPEFDAAESPEAARRGEGGVAIELMAHAWDETAAFSLDDQIRANLSFPIYSQALDDYKAKQSDELRKLRLEVSKPYTAALSALKAARKRLASARSSFAQKPTQASRERVRKQAAKFYEAEREYLEAARVKDKKLRQLDRRRQEMDNGYGWMSDEALYPYGALDAAAELELARFYIGTLHEDRFGNDSWQAYWLSHRALPAALEINCTGLLVDQQRTDELAEVFDKKRIELLEEIRTRAQWPDFNPASPFHVGEFLFGEKYNGYLQQYGKRVRCRPPGALTLRIEPLRDTSDYPKPWSEVREHGLEDRSRPSTDKQTLGELFYAKENCIVRRFDRQSGKWLFKKEDMSEWVGLLRDYRMIEQALKGILRKPESDSRGTYVTDDDGHFNYGDGIGKYICSDGRVRTTIRQTVETGRWGSLNPNMQNCSNSRQQDYDRILGGNSPGPLRSMFCADEGHFIIQADLTGAELLMLAVMAEDGVMIDHCLRNQLPEDHPDHYDIHSNLTVETFRLNCEPTKSGLKSIGKGHLRVLGKSVVFGSLYARGARAVATAARQDGVFVTVEEAQALQDKFFSTYSRVKAFMEECHRRVDAGWMRNMYGRYRRFPFTKDETLKQAMYRESQNAPIQGGVADNMSIAIREVYDYRNRHNMDFSICLQIHDAILLLVPHYELLKVIDMESGVLKQCMTSTPLIASKLDGRAIPDAPPYHFGIDIDIYGSWGQLATPERFIPYGLDPGIAGYKFNDELNVWEHPKAYPNRQWDKGGNELKELKVEKSDLIKV